MKHKKIFKSLLLCTASVLPVVTLASCSSTVSQYGIYSTVSSTYNYDANTDKDKTFGGYKFNNTQISANSTLTDQNDYSSLGWRYVVAPILVFFTSLINLSLLQPNLNNAIETNPIFSFNTTTSNQANDEQNTSNEALLAEFLCASSNVLNHGRSGQIKFGFTGVHTTFKIDSTSSTQTFQTAETETTTTETNNSVYAKENQELTVGTKTNENANTAYFDSNLKFTVSAKLGYWYSEKNNPDAGSISDIEVIKNYVSENKSWPSTIVPTHTTFELRFNFDIKIRSTYIGIKDSFDASKNSSNSSGSQSGATYAEATDSTDEDKPSIEKVKLSKTDFENVKPVFSLQSFTPTINNDKYSDSNASTTTDTQSKANDDSANKPTVELTSEMMNTDISEISTLLSKYDETKVNELKNKYRNVFILSVIN